MFSYFINVYRIGKCRLTGLGTEEEKEKIFNFTSTQLPNLTVDEICKLLFGFIRLRLLAHNTNIVFRKALHSYLRDNSDLSEDNIRYLFKS